MKENILYSQELTENQHRVYIDAVQAYRAYMEALVLSQRYTGTMRWKKSGGREYLFRAYGRKGYGKSLGPRNPEKEALKDRFMSEKQEAADRLQSLMKNLAEQARFCKAAKINRVPNIVTGILRSLEKQKLLGSGVVVVGTHALYAYEAMAGVRFSPLITATNDIDLLWHDSARLRLDGEVSSRGMMGVLVSVDKTFKRMKQKYKAVNAQGFEVDLIKREPKNRMMVDENTSLGGDSEDLQAIGIDSQKWLNASPKVDVIIIGMDGFPAPISVIDPRVFVLHKLWMSQDLSRENIKRKRDKSQAIAVAEVILNHLPDYRFSEKELKMLPRKIIDIGKKEPTLPSGF